MVSDYLATQTCFAADGAHRNTKERFTVNRLKQGLHRSFYPRLSFSHVLDSDKKLSVKKGFYFLHLVGKNSRTTLYQSTCICKMSGYFNGHVSEEARLSVSHTYE